MKYLFPLTNLLLVLACVSSCKPAIDTSKDRVPAWAVGGTLHNTRLPNWAHGTPEDKLATAGEVLYGELWQGHLESDEQLSAFRRQSEKLVRMLDDMSGLYPRLLQVNPSVVAHLPQLSTHSGRIRVFHRRKFFTTLDTFLKLPCSPDRPLAG